MISDLVLDRWGLLVNNGGLTITTAKELTMAQAEEPGLVDTVTDAVGDSMPGRIADTIVDTGSEAIGGGGEDAPAEPVILAEDAPWYTQLYHEQMIPMYQEYLAPFVDMIPWAGIFAAGLTLFFVIGGMNDIASGRG